MVAQRLQDGPGSGRVPRRKSAGSAAEADRSRETLLNSGDVYCCCRLGLCNRHATSMGIRASRGDIAVRGLVCTRSLAEDGLQCPAWPPACVFEAAPWPDGCMRAKPPRLLSHRLLISIGKGRQRLGRPCSETWVHAPGPQALHVPPSHSSTSDMLVEAGRGTPTEVSAALPR